MQSKVAVSQIRESATLLPFVARKNGTNPDAAGSIKHDIGSSVVDADHSMLIELLENFEAGCNDRVSLDNGCAQCSDATAQSCRKGLVNIAGKVQALLLDHFQRESELMNLLPRTVATTSHCVRHRREHVCFSTRYNHAVARLDVCQPGISARKIEEFLAEWIRGHMHAYDVELHSLLTAAGVAAPGAG